MFVREGYEVRAVSFCCVIADVAFHMVAGSENLVMRPTAIAIRFRMSVRLFHIR